MPGIWLRTYLSYSLKGKIKIDVYMTWTMDGLRYLSTQEGRFSCVLFVCYNWMVRALPLYSTS